MKKYELLLLFSTSLKKEERELKAKKLLDALGAKVIKKDEMGEKELAYPIKKEEKGYYIINYIESDGKNNSKFNKLARIEKGLLRFLLIAFEDKFPYEMKTDAPFERMAPRRPFTPRRKNFNTSKEEASEKKVEDKKEVKTEKKVEKDA